MDEQQACGQKLTDEQGRVLVRLARQTLMTRFGQPPLPAETAELNLALQDDCLQRRSGTFVCLKIDGQLRGCIGSLAADGTLIESVRRNALSAAFEDPRFFPLEPAELDRAAIEVSVLTEPQALAYRDAADLLSKLRPRVDGMIIRKGFASATFLPQVWEQLPQPESFLSHLCQKAGLPADAWRYSPLDVMTYQVQYFSDSGVAG